MQGLMGLVEDLGFYPRKVGVLEGYWQRRVGPKSVFWNELLGAWKRWDTRPAMDDGTRPGGAEKKEEVGRLWVHYEDKTGIICHQIRCGRGRGGLLGGKPTVLWYQGSRKNGREMAQKTTPQLRPKPLGQSTGPNSRPCECIQAPKNRQRTPSSPLWTRPFT